VSVHARPVLAIKPRMLFLLQQENYNRIKGIKDLDPKLRIVSLSLRLVTVTVALALTMVFFLPSGEVEAQGSPGNLDDIWIEFESNQYLDDPYFVIHNEDPDNDITLYPMYDFLATKGNQDVYLSDEPITVPMDGGIAEYHFNEFITPGLVDGGYSVINRWDNSIVSMGVGDLYPHAENFVNAEESAVNFRFSNGNSAGGNSIHLNCDQDMQIQKLGPNGQYSTVRFMDPCDLTIQPEQTAVLTWDGKDGGDIFVEPGMYRISVMEHNYPSSTFFIGDNWFHYPQISIYFDCPVQNANEDCLYSPGSKEWIHYNNNGPAYYDLPCHGPFKISDISGLRLDSCSLEPANLNVYSGTIPTDYQFRWQDDFGYDLEEGFYTYEFVPTGQTIDFEIALIYEDVDYTGLGCPDEGAEPMCEAKNYDYIDLNFYNYYGESFSIPCNDAFYIEMDLIQVNSYCQLNEGAPLYIPPGPYTYSWYVADSTGWELPLGDYTIHYPFKSESDQFRVVESYMDLELYVNPIVESGSTTQIKITNKGATNEWLECEDVDLYRNSYYVETQIANCGTQSLAAGMSYWINWDVVDQYWDHLEEGTYELVHGPSGAQSGVYIEDSCEDIINEFQNWNVYVDTYDQQETYFWVEDMDGTYVDGQYQCDLSDYEFRWNFGDGSSYSNYDVEYHYEPGSYEASLEIFDEHGIKVAHFSLSVWIDEGSIIIGPEGGGSWEEHSFALEGVVWTDGQTVDFQVLMDGMPIDGEVEMDARWFLGDSTEINGLQVRHSYAVSDNYLVKADVWGDDIGLLEHEAIQLDLYIDVDAAHAGQEQEGANTYQWLPDERLVLQMFVNENYRADFNTFEKDYQYDYDVDSSFVRLNLYGEGEPALVEIFVHQAIFDGLKTEIAVLFDDNEVASDDWGYVQNSNSNDASYAYSFQDGYLFMLIYLPSDGNSEVEVQFGNYDAEGHDDGGWTENLFGDGFGALGGGAVGTLAGALAGAIAVLLFFAPRLLGKGKNAGGTMVPQPQIQIETDINALFDADDDLGPSLNDSPVMNIDNPVALSGDNIPSFGDSDSTDVPVFDELPEIDDLFPLDLKETD